ncbi:hypothetical protein TARUN_3321 [Trichoderma arundinaceum]|uniref:Uncharacterized protein n=1 Tax=Trichoderma arundinaceum TaxID=490622 RepID=A0A395NSK4_TRIAR|nr:hypothetical protein TARUN_3321 [Trichoderma arundinaceum]
MDGLSSCGEFIAFDPAEVALRCAQESPEEPNLARHAVDVAKGAIDLGLDIGKWALQHAGVPADVRAAVQDAAQRAVNSSMDKSEEEDELLTPMGSVEVRVTDVSWLSSKAIQGEDINPRE